MFDKFLNKADGKEEASGSDQASHGESSDISINGSPGNEADSYRYTQVDSEVRQGKELQATSEDGEVYAGAWVRDIFETAYNQSQQATWVGYVDDAMRGVRAVPLEHEALFRHIALFGTTGYGKSTLLINLIVQWAYAGYGFCFQDPKGDDVLRLLQRLPEHRLEDVIWIEPAPTDHEQVVGLNFLEAGEAQSEVEFEYEIESILNDLKAILRGEDYWGPTMNAIIENIGRAMIRSDQPYTILDMYFVLTDEDRRHTFAESVEDDVVREYTQKIAEMDDDTIDPVLKRIQGWVENRITREIVAHRESSVNIKEAVEDGKIILVRNTVDSEDMKQMVATGIMRRIWAAIKSRESIPESERTPYFMVVDEFDDVVSEDANVNKMLSKARSMRMSVTLANQHPSQLPEEMQKAIFANCDNLLAFNPNEPDDARVIMKRFGDATTEDLLNLGRFKVFTRIMVDTERSDPFISHTFPTYPPLRSRDEARQVIAQSLDRYGVERLDPAEITNDLIIGGGQEQDASGPEEATPSVKRQRAVLEAIFTVQIQGDYDDNWVAAEAVSEELATRIPDPSASQVSNLIEKVPEDLVEIARRNGTTMLKLTSAGQAKVFTQDTGSSASGGGVEHRVLLRRVFEVFTQLGFTVEIPRQEGRKQPDGVANLPIDPQSESLAEAQAKEQRLKEEYPVAYAISGGRHLTIEAATTTLKKPKQPLTNLQKALEADRKCVFAVMDGESTHGSFAYWAERGERILTEPPFVRGIDADGNRTFYNAATQLEVEEEVYALRPADARQAVWEEDGAALVLRDGNGTEQARFSDFEQFTSPSRDDVPATYTYDGGQFNVQTGTRRQTYSSVEALKEDWVRVRRPFIPELEFPREPTDDDWMFVVFPDDDKGLPPQIYEDGELRPLFPTDDDPELGEEQVEALEADPQDDQTSESTDRRAANQGVEAECKHGNDPETCIWCNS